MTIDSVTATTMTVKWEAPVDNGPIERYLVTVESKGDTRSPLRIESESTSCILENLSGNTIYSITVQAGFSAVDGVAINCSAPSEAIERKTGIAGNPLLKNSEINY